MKHLLCVTLFLLTIGNSITDAQCISTSSFNGSLNFSSTVSSIPNDMAPTGWNKTNTPDQARTGIQIDCTTLPLVASPNGGTWTRMADKISAQEAIYQSISGFTIGTSYEVSFHQSLVKNWARSSGNVKVTIGGTSRYSTTITLPAASIAQTSWQTVTVGPFLATATSMTVTLEAHSNQDGTGSSPMPGSCSGYTQNALAADLMIDGVIICPISSLPVNFLSFDLTSENSSITLNWNVSDPENELNKFIVSSTTDLNNWKQLGEVSGKATESNYALPVTSRSVIQSYYKIEAFNKNNELVAISPIISDKNLINSKPCGWTYDKETGVLTTSSEENGLSSVLYDLKGNVLLNYSSFDASTVISTGSLPEGLYILLTNTEAESCAFRFLR